MNYFIEKFDVIDSTNDYLQRKLYDKSLDCSKKYLVISKSQTNGHGSKGRTFISDIDKGIYFSLLVFYDSKKLDEHNIDLQDLLSFLTPNICVALKDCFKECFDKELVIKWVNDLYYNHKKVVGVLCKHFPDKQAIIIGIGIDLYKNENLPSDLRDKVGFIFDYKIEDNVIHQFILKVASEIYDDLYIGKIKSDYFINNMVINKKVKYHGQIGTILAISEKGHLLVDNGYSKIDIDSYDVEILG